MSENSKYAVAFSMGAAFLCLVGMGYSWEQVRSMRRMIAGSTERIKDLSHVEIDRKMVEQMVQKSVREQASAAAREAADKAGREILADMKNRVRQAVANQQGEISKRVAQKMSAEIAELSRDEIVDDVVSATTEKLIEKLSDELDGEVGRIGKVFTGIAAAMR